MVTNHVIKRAASFFLRRVLLFDGVSASASPSAGSESVESFVEVCLPCLDNRPVLELSVSVDASSHGGGDTLSFLSGLIWSRSSSLLILVAGCESSSCSPTLAVAAVAADFSSRIRVLSRDLPLFLVTRSAMVRLSSDRTRFLLSVTRLWRRQCQ
jgi:hypothetical protein